MRELHCAHIARTYKSSAVERDTRWTANHVFIRDLLQLRRGNQMWIMDGSATHLCKTHIAAARTYCMYHIPVGARVKSTIETAENTVPQCPDFALSLASRLPFSAQVYPHAARDWHNEFCKQNEYAHAVALTSVLCVVECSYLPADGGSPRRITKVDAEPYKVREHQRQDVKRQAQPERSVNANAKLFC